MRRIFFRMTVLCFLPMMLMTYTIIEPFIVNLSLGDLILPLLLAQILLEMCKDKDKIVCFKRDYVFYLIVSLITFRFISSYFATRSLDIDLLLSNLKLVVVSLYFIVGKYISSEFDHEKLRYALFYSIFSYCLVGLIGYILSGGGHYLLVIMEDSLLLK